MVITSVAYGVAMTILAVTFFLTQRTLGDELEQATASYVEEQNIADRIGSGMMRQLGAATAYRLAPDPELEADFRNAGDQVQSAILRYLFRDLSLPERLQLEKVKEQHQRMEVTAARSLELTARGRSAEAALAGREMVAHAMSLQEATSSFLAMRQAELGRLQSQQAEGLRLLYLAAGGLAVVLILSSVLWGGFLNRRLARPLAELTEAATRIGRGDLSVRVPVPAEAELALLAHRFNTMSDRLDRARADLEERNRELEGAVERVRETQAELVQAEKLSAMGRMAAGLAHELNNPLASVLGYGQLLAERVDDGDVPEPEALREEYLDPLVREAVRARDLVQNLLRFTRKSGVQPRSVPLAEALEVVSGLRSYALTQAGVNLTMDPADDVWIRADPQRLQQILVNVVNNAADAIIENQAGGDRTIGGRIHVEVRQERETVVVAVVDDGPGFDDVDRAFEPFYTTKPVGSGTGLGLPIVHRFVEEAGGTVSVENRREGGARVELRFPQARPDEATSTPDPDAGDDGSAASNAPAAVGPDPSLRILLVEDEPALRSLQERLLSRNGARVLTAEGGHAARRILETTEVDLVVSDVKMPDGGGMELYQWVERERPGLAERFMFVTGDLGEPALEALARVRPDRFVTKPFHTGEYLARVTSMAARVVG